MRNWERQIASIYWGWQMPGRSGLANIPTHLTKRFKLTAAGGDVCTGAAPPHEEHELETKKLRERKTGQGQGQSKGVSIVTSDASMQIFETYFGQSSNHHYVPQSSYSVFPTIRGTPGAQG